MSSSPTNIKIRSAKVEFGITTALGSEFGYVKDVKIKISPAVSEIDSQGIPIVPGYKIECQFRALENKASQLAAFYGLVMGTYRYIKFTDRNTSSLSFVFPLPALLYIETESDLTGKADGLLMKFTMNLPGSDLTDLLPV